MRPRLRTSTLVLVLAAACAAPQHSTYPMKFPRGQILARARRLAVLPTAAPGAPAGAPERAREVFEPLLEAKLRALGFETLPGDRVRAVYDEILAAHPGAYDPAEGRPDPRAVQGFLAHLRDALKARLEADSIAISTIAREGGPGSAPLLRVVIDDIDGNKMFDQTVAVVAADPGQGAGAVDAALAPLAPKR